MCIRDRTCTAATIWRTVSSGVYTSETLEQTASIRAYTLETVGRTVSSRVYTSETVEQTVSSRAYTLETVGRMVSSRVCTPETVGGRSDKINHEINHPTRVRELGPGRGPPHGSTWAPHGLHMGFTWAPHELGSE